jgi:DNA primase large subunit
LIKDYKVKLIRGKCEITAENALIVLQELYNSIQFIHYKEIHTYHDQLMSTDSRISTLSQKLMVYYDDLLKHTVTSFQSNKGINLGNIDHLAQTYFPLCMSEIFNALRTNHQLKHWGRL